MLPDFPEDHQSASQISDAVVAAMSQHDPAACAEVYRRYVKQIYHYALARVNNVSDAQDLTSQTFIAALECISRYRGQNQFTAWLFGIAHHKVTDYFRRRAPESLDAAAHLAAATPLPDEAAERKLQLEQVIEVLTTLSPDRAEAVALRVFGGLCPAEASQIMNRDQAAVTMLVYRGLRDLRQRVSIPQEEIEDAQ